MRCKHGKLLDDYCGSCGAGDLSDMPQQMRDAAAAARARLAEVERERDEAVAKARALFAELAILKCYGSDTAKTVTPIITSALKLGGD